MVGLGGVGGPLLCRFPLLGMLGLQDTTRVIAVELAEAQESSRGVDVASGVGDVASVALDAASGALDVASGAGDVASAAVDVVSGMVDVASGAGDVAFVVLDVASSTVDDTSGAVDVSGMGIAGAGIGVRGSLISTEGVLGVAIEAFALLEREGLEAE